MSENFGHPIRMLKKYVKHKFMLKFLYRIGSKVATMIPKFLRVDRFSDPYKRPLRDVTKSYDVTALLFW